MNAIVNPILLACLCVGVAGCAILPAAALSAAAQGAQGLVVLTLGPLVNMQDRSEKDRCVAYTSKGISVTESLEIAIPNDEGVVIMFELASWRPEFSLDGYPQVERFRTPTEGTLAISERAALLLPPRGTTSVRIPYELVQNVDVRRSDGGEARYMIVNSCFGRFDIVTFSRRQPNNVDPEATTAAAAQLKSRVAAFHTAADN
jgi:hypothetical protein